MNPTRAYLVAVIVSLAGLAGLLQLPTPVQAQSGADSVPAGAAFSSVHTDLPALADGATAGPTGPVAGDRGVAAPAESPSSGGSAAKDSAGLSALAVVMLVLIVAGTALVGSRKSSR